MASYPYPKTIGGSLKATYNALDFQDTTLTSTSLNNNYIKTTGGEYKWKSCNFWVFRFINNRYSKYHRYSQCFSIQRFCEFKSNVYGVYEF